MSYGRCPYCNGAVVERERRPNGNDRCDIGHVYPSRLTLPSARPPTASDVQYHGHRFNAGMLRLTNSHRDDQPVWIAPAHVVAVLPNNLTPDRAEVLTSAGVLYSVMESPSDVLSLLLGEAK